MQELSKGQRTKINSALELKFDTFYDVSCFCLDANDKLINDEHMIFYNQVSSPDGSVKLNNSNGQQTFVLDLDKANSKIQKLSFVITADEKILKDLNKPFACNSSEFSFVAQPQALEKEKALMFCEVYLKDGQWRLNAYAQGFNDGLQAVVAHYGGETASSTPAAIQASAPVAASKPVSLTKISLTKDSGPAKVSLKKDMDEGNMIELSALWYDNGDGNSGNDDLDLRVGLLMPDGRMTLIHGGGDAGSLTQKPYIQHSGDVQVVQGSVGVEKVKINPKISQLFGGKVAVVVSVYSAVANGAVSVASLKPKMEIKTKDNHITCEFNTGMSSNPTIYTYVIGMIVIDGDNLSVKQLGTTSKPNSEATPWLTWDNGEFPQIDIVGPSHFKGQPISYDTVSLSGGLFSKNKVKGQYVEHRDL
jgi:tellurite resistance protein TerA